MYGGNLVNGGAIKLYARNHSTRPKELDLITNNQTRMTITSDGDVGIGTTSPDHLLHLSKTSTTANATSALLVASYDLSDTPSNGTAFTSAVFSGDITHAGMGYLRFENAYNTSTPNRWSAIQAGTNYPVYGDGPGALGGDSGHLLLNPYGGNVGIGTTSPNKTLEVEYVSTSTNVTEEGLLGGAAGKGILIYNSQESDNVYANLDFRARNADGRIAYQYQAATNVGDFHFITDNTNSPQTMMIIKNNGNVGIGTTDPNQLLDIDGITRIRRAGTVTTEYLDIEVTDSVATFSISQDEATFGGFIFNLDDNSGSSINSAFRISNSTPTDLLTVRSDGKVGIGTTTPDYELEVSTSSNSRIAATSVTNSVVNHLQADSSGAYVGPLSNHSLFIKTNNTTRVTVDTSGNVGIGTTSPSVKLEVKDSQDSSIDSGIGIVRSANSQTGYINMVGGAFNFNAPSAIAIKFRDGGTTNMTILGDGNVGIGTTSPSNRLHIQHSAVTTDQALFIHNTNNGNDAGIKFSDNTTAAQNGIFYYSHVDTSSNGTANSFHFNSDQTNLAVIIDQTNANSGYYIGESSPVVAIRGGGDSFFNGGNVGIGTTSPSQKLDVRGDFRLNGAIAQYSTAANSTVLNRFWNNTGGVLLAELALYDFGTSLVGGQLSFGEGISKYATLRGTNTDGGKLTLETTSSSTDTVFNETGAAFDFRIEGDVDPNLFFVDGSADKIGVGTSNPASKLQIVSSTSGDSVLKVDGTNGTLFEVVDDLSDSLMSVNDAAGLPVLEVFADSTVIGGRYNQNDFYIDGSDGRVGIGTNNPSYNLEVTGTAHVTGTFTAGTKSFLINHPTKEDHMLQYGSLEGPEYGVYVRGKTDLSEIELPEVWINLVHEGSITVSFTPRGKFLPLFLNKIENNTIYVGGTEGGVFYDYVVYGTRKDVDDLVTEFTK